MKGDCQISRRGPPLAELLDSVSMATLRQGPIRLARSTDHPGALCIGMRRIASARSEAMLPLAGSMTARVATVDSPFVIVAVPRRTSMVIAVPAPNRMPAAIAVISPMTGPVAIPMAVVAVSIAVVSVVVPIAASHRTAGRKTQQRSRQTRQKAFGVHVWPLFAFELAAVSVAMPMTAVRVRAPPAVVATMGHHHACTQCAADQAGNG